MSFGLCIYRANRFNNRDVVVIQINEMIGQMNALVFLMNEFDFFGFNSKFEISIQNS